MVPWSLQFRANDARLSTPQTFLLLHSKRSAKVDATCQLEPGGKTIRNSAVFLCLFLFIFPSFLHLCPCEGSVFLWHLSQGQRRSTLDGERRSSRPEISGDGNWQITRFSSSQASAPCTAYGSKLFESRQGREELKMNTCNIMQSYEHESPTPSDFVFFHFIINKKSESVRRRHCSGKPTQAPAEQESKDSLVLSAWLCPRQLEADLFVIEFCTTLLDLFEKEGNGSIAI